MSRSVPRPPGSRGTKEKAMTSTTARHTTIDTDQNRSIRNAGIIAGTALLLMSVLAGFGYFVAVKGLVTPGNPAQTATDITESDGLFRLGIASLYLVIPL